MSNKTLTVLVIISLSFNLAFLTGFVYTRIAGPIGPRPGDKPMITPHHIMEHLKIDKQQFRKLTHNHRTAQMEFYRELSKEEFNEKILQKKLLESLNYQRELDQEIGKSLIKYRSKLNTEDAEKIFKKLYRNRRYKTIRPNNKQGEKNEKD